MKYNIDLDYLLDTFKTLVDTHSPTGYFVKLNPILEELAGKLNLSVTYDRRSTAYITLKGKTSDKKVMVGAHADTIGMLVYKIENDGTLRTRPLGGVMYHSLEGETVRVFTRDGREYTGLVAAASHSPHVFEDARTLPRDEFNMVIMLDQPVKTKSDVQALGIANGDFISAEPRTCVTESGYLKSRYIDDKGAIACCFAALKYMVENNLTPSRDIVFAFPYYEEKGGGGSYIPEGIDEYVAVDIGLVGPDLDGDERKVSICTADAKFPYNYELTNRIIECAKNADCEYALDVFYRYGTDASAAMLAGNNLRTAAFGMAVVCSHGMERTHTDGLIGTSNIILEYILN